ncbi:protoheme IX farnesyltransferase [Mucilaginibacter roseus]|uniref:Protoheme IX farnesyltransferase n=1 Tax=Mucilaginibacter roseus TaxID=1528868 RepID=A0ABS8TYH9_9SPHI|nr:protoheme IX farnesyltransferase [Mucilaginibacter roseus]MCD8739017.1 protoheme IX farnesyltransferase [Mucilaginibacter roseus]
MTNARTITDPEGVQVRRAGSWKYILNDFAQLIKFRLTISVTFSCSMTYLIGLKYLNSGDTLTGFDWGAWFNLVFGGFLVTAAAGCLNEVIEVKTDALMDRTRNRPLPAGRLTTGQGLVIAMIMSLAGTKILSSISLVIGLLSFVSILVYAFIYTPLKSRTRFAVLVGAFPGAFPPLIGYLAAVHQNPVLHRENILLGVIVFLFQFIWQFPHFWAIAWSAYNDYSKAGIYLLPDRKQSRKSAVIIFISALALILVGISPGLFGILSAWAVGVIFMLGLVFLWSAAKLILEPSRNNARQLMFNSLFYLPAFHLVLLFC